MMKSSLEREFSKYQNKSGLQMMTQLSLFDSEEFYEFPKDLLEYKENFLSREEADLLKNKLLRDAPWEQRTQKMYDKTVLTPRLTAWYGDAKSYEPADSNISKTNQWTPELYALKERIENEFGCQFNGVLLNLYRDNNDSVAQG